MVSSPTSSTMGWLLTQARTSLCFHPSSHPSSSIQPGIPLQPKTHEETLWPHTNSMGCHFSACLQLSPHCLDDPLLQPSPASGPWQVPCLLLGMCGLRGCGWSPLLKWLPWPAPWLLLTALPFHSTHTYFASFLSEQSRSFEAFSAASSLPCTQ